MADQVYHAEEIADTAFPTEVAQTPYGSTDTGSAVVVGNETINNQSFPTSQIKDLISNSFNTITRKIKGSYTFTQHGAIQIGQYKAGASGEIKISPAGLSATNTAGQTSFAIDGETGDATFMGTILAGSVIASSILAGFITVGGASADVNSHATTISGTKLTTGTVTADYVVASISISSPTITGGSIAIGSGNNIFKADGNGIYLGHATYGSAPFRVDMSGNLTATSATISGTITSGGGSSYTGNAISDSYIGNIHASKIVAGTLTVGSGGADAITIKHTTSKANAIVKWEGGSSIWEDSSNYLGLWAYGGQMYFWSAGDGDPRLVLLTGSNQNSMYGGLYIHKVGGNGGNLNVEGDMKLDGHFTDNVNFDNHMITNVQQIASTVINNTTLNGNTIYYWNLHYYSDISLKSDVKSTVLGLTELNKLSPIEFKFTEDPSGDKHYGFVAQDFEKIFPELTGEDTNGIKGIDITQLIPLLVNAVKELSDRVVVLEKAVKI
jgi:hypothetical protein